MSSPLPCSMFVYGTLKRGYLRESIWPKTPSMVAPAVIRADLYDLGPYPAISEGEGWVQGELWRFDPCEMDHTLAVLDEAEGFNQEGSPNYYVRKVVNATTTDGRNELAYAYFLGENRDRKSLRKIEASVEFDGKRCAQWPDALSRVPRSIAEERSLEKATSHS